MGEVCGVSVSNLMGGVSEGKGGCRVRESLSAGRMAKDVLSKGSCSECELEREGYR